MRKAKFIKTGEIVNVHNIDYCGYGQDVALIELSNGTTNNVMLSDIQFIDQTPDLIDWEQRRYELAKDFEAASLANPEYLQYATTGRRIDSPEERLANVSIKYADALIKKLQER